MTDFQSEDKGITKKNSTEKNDMAGSDSCDEKIVSKCDTEDGNKEMTSSLRKESEIRPFDVNDDRANSIQKQIHNDDDFFMLQHQNLVEIPAQQIMQMPHFPTSFSLQRIKTPLQLVYPELTGEKPSAKMKETSQKRLPQSLSPTVDNQRSVSDIKETKDNSNNFVQRKYRDISLYADPITARGRNCGGVTEPFPEKLHSMLEYAEKRNLTDVVSFLPHGRAFAVHLPKRFVAEIMPRFFRQTRITSFQRQLNLYGFQRICNGPDTGAYYHELFLRGRPGLVVIMRRTKVKGTMKTKRNPIVDPDFYSMSPVVGDNQCANFSKGNSDNEEKHHNNDLHNEEQSQSELDTKKSDCSTSASSIYEAAGKKLEVGQGTIFESKQQKQVEMVKQYEPQVRLKTHQHLRPLAPRPMQVGHQLPFPHSQAQYPPISSIIAGNNFNHISEPFSKLPLSTIQLAMNYKNFLVPSISTITNGNRLEHLNAQKVLGPDSSHPPISVQDSLQLEQITKQTQLQEFPMDIQQSPLLPNVFSNSTIANPLQLHPQSESQIAIPMKMNDIASQNALLLYKTEPSQSLPSSRFTALPTLSQMYFQREQNQNHHIIQTQLGHITRSAATGVLSNNAVNFGNNQNSMKSHAYIPSSTIQQNHLQKWSYSNYRG